MVTVVIEGLLSHCWPTDHFELCSPVGGPKKKVAKEIYMSYITQTRSGGQQACQRVEGLSTSNINKAFLDAAKDILKNN
ncbi:hypothetical protein PROFUN_12608 [Planoprotostelium fungivorum]|uniref:Uncharacterized protein n=1 Tax=Planoprotostelium fungivorum TaxID=1890364 RepID=A0A2P6N710_9EUKA|nr:hypothetical protein PROFUN_12608 [Planoprotostelium fungivorum]